MADTQQVKSVEERKDEELVHELFRVFPRVFSKREPRDEYFVNVLSKGEVTIGDIVQSPAVQAVTTDAEIIKRAIHRFRGFTVTEEVVKQCTYQKTDPQNTVVIKDLPLGLQQEQVIALFHNETTPGPKAVSARADQYNTWYVNFSSEDDSKAACALGKSLTYEGKALRVTLKRDLHSRHGYDPRGMGRPEYSNVDMMQMPHLMNPFQMYYSPVMANNAYYQYPPAGMPYPPMGSPVVYPMEMPPMGYPGYYMPQAYYPPGAQQQQQQQGTQQSGMGFQQGRRPGRGGYAQAGAAGRGYNGPRKERSPRPVENQPAATEATQAMGEKAAEAVSGTEEKPLITATTNESAAVAAEEAMTTVEETAVAVESLEIKEEAKKVPEEGEKRAPRQRSEGDRYGKSSGDRERRTSERKSQNAGAGARNGKSRERSQPSSGARGDGSETKKPKAAAIKFTMDSDFPILVDQKQGAPSPSMGFDYANAVKKAPAPVTPPSPPEQRAVSPTVEKAAAPVVEAVVEPVVVPEVQKAVAAVEERVQASAPVEPETKVAAPTGTTKKSFLDALKANQ